MNRDPHQINKNTKILMKLLAEIINDFFDPLSYKAFGALIFGSVAFLFCISYIFS